MQPSSRVLVLLLFYTLSAWSQTRPLLPQVQQFLGLTDAQVTAILQNNQDYNTFSLRQQQQIINAQFQISRETGKDQLDPLALGTLYAGIESACRDLRDKAAFSQQQNISVLNDAQRAKLNSLNDAVKLNPTIAEAQGGNLIGSVASPPYAFTSTSNSGINGLFQTGLAISGCT